jgi:hypothetical protein
MPERLERLRPLNNKQEACLSTDLETLRVVSASYTRKGPHLGLSDLWFGAWKELVRRLQTKI